MRAMSIEGAGGVRVGPDVLGGTIQPDRVVVRTVPLDEVSAGYQAMVDRKALRVVVAP